MNRQILVKGLAAAGWMMFAAPLHAAPVLPHVSLKVTLDNGSDYKKIQGSSGKSREEKIQLNITLDNRDNVQIKDLTVEWAIYSHPLGKVKLDKAGHGTKKLTIAPLKSEDIKSDKITITGTPKHGVVSQDKNRNNNNANNGNNQNNIITKSVAATGSQYYGYAVQLYSGGTLLDQAYSQSNLKR